MVDAVWHQVVEGGITIRDLFGSPDDVKLVSSLTLFARVARQDGSPGPHLVAFIARADEILEAANSQGFDPCTKTERFLGV
jgi:hypothetical protein